MISKTITIAVILSGISATMVEDRILEPMMPQRMEIEQEPEMIRDTYVYNDAYPYENVIYDIGGCGKAHNFEKFCKEFFRHARNGMYKISGTGHSNGYYSISEGIGDTGTSRTLNRDGTSTESTLVWIDGPEGSDRKLIVTDMDINGKILNRDEIGIEVPQYEDTSRGITGGPGSIPRRYREEKVVIEKQPLIELVREEPIIEKKQYTDAYPYSNSIGNIENCYKAKDFERSCQEFFGVFPRGKYEISGEGHKNYYSISKGVGNTGLSAQMDMDGTETRTENIWIDGYHGSDRRTIITKKDKNGKITRNEFQINTPEVEKEYILPERTNFDKKPVVMTTEEETLLAPRKRRLVFRGRH